MQKSYNLATAIAEIKSITPENSTWGNLRTIWESLTFSLFYCIFLFDKNCIYAVQHIQGSQNYLFEYCQNFVTLLNLYVKWEKKTPPKNGSYN